jgi:hypothetical protein
MNLRGVEVTDGIFTRAAQITIGFILDSGAYLSGGVLWKENRCFFWSTLALPSGHSRRLN